MRFCSDLAIFTAMSLTSDVGDETVTVTPSLSDFCCCCSPCGCCCWLLLSRLLLMLREEPRCSWRCSCWPEREEEREKVESPFCCSPFCCSPLCCSSFDCCSLTRACCWLLMRELIFSNSSALSLASLALASASCCASSRIFSPC